VQRGSGRDAVVRLPWHVEVAHRPLPVAAEHPSDAVVTPVLPDGSSPWPISVDLGLLLGRLVAEHDRRSVLEFGAGRSSLVVATAMAAQGGGTLTSLEQDVTWCAELWTQVEAVGSDVDAELAPVTPRLGWSPIGLHHRYEVQTIRAASRCAPGSPSTRPRPVGSWPRPGTWRRTGREPWGLDADPIHQLIIDDELRRAGVRRPNNPIGIGWAGPTLVTPAPRAAGPLPARCSRARRSGASSSASPRPAATWPTSAPGPCATATSGSSTAQKIWTSLAQFATFGILIARTDPDVPKHQGISYFVCPMDTPGIEIRPIIEMTGGHTFNEVFLTDVRLPADALVGEVNRGGAGQGHAGQRAGVAVVRRRRCGAWAPRRRPARPGA
jgi:hypothetical protein